MTESKLFHNSTLAAEFVSSIGAKMIKVTGGSFVMGSPQDEVGRAFWEAEREVTLPYEFYLGATPVTQRQFELVIPCPRYASCSWAEKRATDHPGTARDAPVDSVGWQGATEFCAKLTQIDREAGILSQDWEYRLPTETEWEYACRAGTSGATYGPLDSIAWHFGNSDLRPHPVGEKAPNPWGFYDMLGNVWELCQDWYSEKSELRAGRGGSYFNTRKSCRAAARSFYAWGGRYSGFRLAAAPVGPLELCPSIEEYPAPPAKPSLWDAFETKDFALAELIVAEDPDQLEGVDWVPPTLHACIYGDLPEIFEWVLDHGADMELREQDFGGTPLGCAVVHRHKRIIRILVERGADTSRAMHIAERGLAGDFEDVPPPEAYREIIELLRELGVK
jgi:formylglycine-generating enzyme required for sulfatase activity